MQLSLIEYSNKIIDLLQSVHKNLKELIIENKNCEFTVPQLLLIHELYHHPNITLNELSERLSLSKSTVSGIINRLVQNGTVIRTVPEYNRRIVTLSLSTNILEKSEIIVKIKTQHLAKLLEPIDKESIKKLIDSLEFLNDILKHKV